MDIFKSIKTKLILQISLLIIISTIFVLFFVNLITQQRPNKDPAPITIDFTLPVSQQREEIQKQIQQNILQERTESAARLLAASFLGIFIQLLFTSAGTYLLIKRELQPLEDLNKSIQDINEKMLYIQISAEDDTSEEISQLITNFNLMMGRLDKAFKAQKQFVENVSHEVKTPLTVIRTNLESIILDKAISIEEQDSAISSSIESINFLNKLVEDLMLLSFLDKGQIKLESIDVADLTKVIIKNLDVMAKSNKINLNFNNEINELIKVHANEILLQRAISNIIENAIKYSKKDSTVDIHLAKHKGSAVIGVTNQSEPISPEFKEKIFERFFRIDKSRNRTTGGFGLGLAITKEIIETFNGQIKLESTSDSNTFTLVFQTSH